MSETTAFLDVLTQRGVLISVSVRYWRACKKLKAEDLGLSSEQIDDQLISLGHKKLLPHEALKTLSVIESRAHALIAETTFPFLNGVSMPQDAPDRKLKASWMACGSRYRGLAW